MKFAGCSREKAVWQAVVSGVWQPGLKEHAADCSICGEVALITRELAKVEKTPTPLPDARQIWWRARWLRTQEAERAARPVLLFQRFAMAGLLLGAALALVYFWAIVSQWLPAPPSQWTLFGVVVPGLVLVTSAIVLAGLAVLFVLHAALAEE